MLRDKIKNYKKDKKKQWIKFYIKINNKGYN